MNIVLYFDSCLHSNLAFLIAESYICHTLKKALNVLLYFIIFQSSQNGWIKSTVTIILYL